MLGAENTPLNIKCWTKDLFRFVVALFISENRSELLHRVESFRVFRTEDALADCKQLPVQFFSFDVLAPVGKSPP